MMDVPNEKNDVISDWIKVKSTELGGFTPNRPVERKHVLPDEDEVSQDETLYPEDLEDRADAIAALEEPDRISLDDLRSELGI